MFSAPPSFGVGASGTGGGGDRPGGHGADSDQGVPGPSPGAAGAGASIASFNREALAQHALNSAITQGAWTTGNTQMDDWLQNNISDEALLLRFARIPITERLELVAQLIKRAPSITNLTSYFAGCINKSLKAPHIGGRSAPYSGAGSREHVPAVRPLPSPVRTRPAIPAVMSLSLPSAPPSPGGLSVASGSVARTVPQTPDSAASNVSTVVARSTVSDKGGFEALKISSWALEALKDARNKGRFLSRVCRQLDTATCSELQQLTPEWMFNIAMAVALGCRGGVDPNLAARHCLQSHADIGGPGRMQNLRGPPGKASLPLIMLHLGSWHAFSQLAVQAAITFAASELRDKQVDVVEVHVFPEDEMSAKVETDIAAAMQWRARVWPSVDAMMPLVAERCSSWANTEAKVLLLSRHVHPSEGRSFTDASPPAVPLHGPNMHILWRHLAAVRFIARHVGNGNVGQFFLSNSTLQGSPTEPVSSWLGHSGCLDPAAYKVPLATHSLHASPVCQNVQSRCAPWDAAREVNGWRWAPGTDALASDLQGIRLHDGIMSLQQVVIFRERDLLPEEHKALQMGRAVHSASGRTGLLPVELHAAMAGCSDLPVVQTMKNMHPCCEMLHPATGMAMQAGAANAEMCGQSRWCTACERVHEVLFGLPHASQLSDHVAAWLGLCLQAWADTTSAHFVDAASCPQHECTSSCSLKDM